MSNQSFHIPVEPAVTGLGVAKSVLKWASKEENKPIFAEFERSVMAELHLCLGDCPKDMRFFQTKRIELCRSYHLLRVSEKFTTSWRDFLRKVECASVPSFYKEVTDVLFEDMLKTMYPLPTSDMQSVTEDINYEDANVVRYVAGYVYRKVAAKIARLQTDFNCNNALKNRFRRRERVLRLQQQTGWKQWTGEVWCMLRREPTCCFVPWRKWRGSIYIQNSSNDGGVQVNCGKGCYGK